MASVTSAPRPIHLGVDTSKNTIVVAVLMPGEEIPVLDRIWNEGGSVRNLANTMVRWASIESRVLFDAGMLPVLPLPRGGPIARGSSA